MYERNGQTGDLVKDSVSCEQEVLFAHVVAVFGRAAVIDDITGNLLNSGGVLRREGNGFDIRHGQRGFRRAGMAPDRAVRGRVLPAPSFDTAQLP